MMVLVEMDLIVKVKVKIVMDSFLMRLKIFTTVSSAVLLFFSAVLYHDFQIEQNTYGHQFNDILADCYIICR